jgi:DNA-binding PadR family transcriptional regulator
MAKVLGAFEQAVLLAVLRLGNEAYGRAISREVQIRLERQIASGAVHATLVRLERKGLLTSHLGPGTVVRAGRPRRYYTLDPAGHRALEAARTAVDTLWRGFEVPAEGRT